MNITRRVWAARITLLIGLIAAQFSMNYSIFGPIVIHVLCGIAAELIMFPEFIKKGRRHKGLLMLPNFVMPGFILLAVMCFRSFYEYYVARRAH